MSHVEETPQELTQERLPRSVGLADLLERESGYAARYDQLVQDVDELSPGELKTAYSSEYWSWANRKHWATANGVQWAVSMIEFGRFLLVNGPIPHKSWTLDRIDPKGDYAPENLRWASKATQSQNRTTSVAIPFRGARYSINEIAQLTGKSYDAIRMGIRRNAEAYIANLLVPAEDETARFEEAMWPFPEEYRDNLEWLYSRRDNEQQNRFRFFIDLTRRDLGRTERELAWSGNSTIRESLEADIAEIRRLHNEAAAYYNELIERDRWRTIEARHQRLYSKVQIPPRPEPDWEGAEEPLPYQPYYV